MKKNLHRLINLISSLRLLPDWLAFYKKNDQRFSLRFRDNLPQLGDKTNQTDFDLHYIYHPAWAARVLAKTKPREHVDIYSSLSFSTLFSAFIPVRFFDFRTANISLSGLQSEAINLTALSFPNDSLPSVSCLHVLEHIGLGRYGDPIDPQGDIKAMTELERVLAPSGDLLIAVPVGQPRLRFNAHRIYSYEQIISAFSQLELVEFSLISEKKHGLISPADPALVEQEKYGCGCFWFKKKAL